MPVQALALINQKRQYHERETDHTFMVLTIFADLPEDFPPDIPMASEVQVKLFIGEGDLARLLAQASPGDQFHLTLQPAGGGKRATPLALD